MSHSEQLPASALGGPGSLAAQFPAQLLPPSVEGGAVASAEADHCRRAVSAFLNTQGDDKALSYRQGMERLIMNERADARQGTSLTEDFISELAVKYALVSVDKSADREAVKQIAEMVAARGQPEPSASAATDEVEAFIDQLDFAAGCNAELTLGPNACADLLRILRAQLSKSAVERATEFMRQHWPVDLLEDVPSAICTGAYRAMQDALAALITRAEAGRTAGTVEVCEKCHLFRVELDRDNDSSNWST